jgi:hypothetical protein
MKCIKFWSQLLFILSVSNYISVNAQNKLPTGAIKGKVVDMDSKTSLIGVNVVLIDTPWGSATDTGGNFIIENIPVGNYSIKFSYISCHPVTRTDVIVRPNRITNCDAELKMSAIKTEAVLVTGGYFDTQDENPTSAINFSGEEIRRAPGSAGDVSRIIYGLPSVAKVNDSKNSLIVRGGAAFEIGFYIDNIEIPNINHFPEYGSSGGPIGMVNVDFIRDVNFYSGGFSTIYGDKLSSIMELSYRDGNRDEFDGQLDLHFAGFGGVAEGPLANGKGSWLISARKSFLDFIVGAIGEDLNSVPNYGDIQGKIVYDISPNHKLTLLNILGIDYINSDRDYAVENEESMYMNFNMTQNTAGINWRYLWGKSGYSNTSISHTIVKGDYLSYDTRTFRDTGIEKKLYEFNPVEQEIKFRNVNYYIMHPSHKLNFGTEIKYILNRHDDYYGDNKDALGNPIEAFKIDGKLDATKLFGFISYNWQPVTKLTIEPGVRIGHFTYNKNTNISPRFSFAYQMNNLTTVNGSAGIFYQNLPLVLLRQNPLNKNLKTPLARHFIFGISHLLSENTRLTVEVYDKGYKYLPLDASQPTFSIIDQIVIDGLFHNPNQLEGVGQAYSRGIEIMLQKKLAKNFYGMISASWFRSKYRDYNGIWRNRSYDNRVTFNIEGGYKPNNKWEFSLRWIYAGGRPYTPFNMNASQQVFQGVYDNSQTNMLRMPDYHSLNIRFDRRFHFSRSNLILYVSVWNAYGRKNITSYDWDEFTNEQSESTQWGLLPIFGLEFEF